MSIRIEPLMRTLGCLSLSLTHTLTPSLAHSHSLSRSLAPSLAPSLSPSLTHILISARAHGTLPTHAAVRVETEGAISLRGLEAEVSRLRGEVRSRDEAIGKLSAELKDTQGNYWREVRGW